MKMWFTTTEGSSVEVWFGEEERSELEEEVEPLYVPALLRVSAMKFSFPSVFYGDVKLTHYLLPPDLYLLILPCTHKYHQGFLICEYYYFVALQLTPEMPQ